MWYLSSVLRFIVRVVVSHIGKNYNLLLSSLVNCEMWGNALWCTAVFYLIRHVKSTFSSKKTEHWFCHIYGCIHCVWGNQQCSTASVKPTAATAADVMSTISTNTSDLPSSALYVLCKNVISIPVYRNVISDMAKWIL